ncbi:MAG: TetR family transcriptional regulator [Ornithinimicrobium sp.]
MSSGIDDTEVAPAASRRSADVTARARIRDAAMGLFAEFGFRATTMRAIGLRAGVSAALVVHHFGSKEGLREAIDDHLADQIRQDKFAAMTGNLMPNEREMRNYAEQFAPAMAYLARALTENTVVGRHLYDRLYRDSVDYLQAGVDAGLIRPTSEPEARAAALLNAGLGQTLLQHHLQRALGSEDQTDALMQIARPMIDLYTDGLFTDQRIRDSWNPPPTDEET